MSGKPKAIGGNPGNRDWLERVGSMLLLSAGFVVAIAIASEGIVARATNGIAGILWITSAALFITMLRSEPQFWTRLLTVAGVGFFLVLVVKPGDLLWAITGFGIAGVLIATLFPERGVTWAMLLAALWLPEHLGVAFVRAITRALRDLPVSVRTEPPPTAALVPLAMILAVWSGAWLTEKIRHRFVATI